MLVRKIDHINIRTTRFADTVTFYVEALGMKNARLPGLPEDRPGSFIEDGSGAFAIHLIPVDPADPLADYDRMMRSRRVSKACRRRVSTAAGRWTISPSSATATRRWSSG